MERLDESIVVNADTPITAILGESPKPFFKRRLDLQKNKLSHGL